MAAAAEQPKVLPKPVDWDELYPGRFLKAADLKGKQWTLRIAKVDLEELVGDKGAQIRGIIGFHGADKALALNKTNGLCLRGMFGKKVQEWVGKRVILYPTQTRGATGKMEDCIRIHGSPDIPSEMEVEIALPRKRPFTMTMHRNESGPSAANSPARAPAQTIAPTAAKPRPSTAPAGEQKPLPVDSAVCIPELRAATTVADIDATWSRVTAAFGGMVPIEVEDVYQIRREELAEQEGKNLN